MSNKRSAAMKKYCKQVKGMLHCSSNTKDILLSGLLDELEEAGENLDYIALVERFGKPEEVAMQLQESVSDEEYKNALKQRRQRKLAMIALMAVMLCIAIGSAFYAWHIWNSTPVTVIEEILESTSLIGTPVD